MEYNIVIKNVANEEVFSMICTGDDVLDNKDIYREKERERERENESERE